MSKRLSHMSDRIDDYTSLTKRLKQSRLNFGTSTLFPQSNRALSQSMKQCKKHQGDFQQADSTFQTHIDLGQKKLAYSICLACGMAYNSANSLDLQFHKSYHPADPYSYCLSSFCSVRNSVISHCDNSIFQISIHSSSRLIQRAKLLWEYLQSDHGFAERNFDLSYSKMQLYAFLNKDINKRVNLQKPSKLGVPPTLAIAGNRIPNHYHYDPETKRISKEWVEEDDPPPTKVRRARSAGNKCGRFFSDLVGLSKLFPSNIERLLLPTGTLQCAYPKSSQQLSHSGRRQAVEEFFFIMIMHHCIR
ncbi:hypothetical protein LOD99_9239 [Oopsacas minuta]|uniref:N-acetyltransferase ESCO zinc-finger domain-containing protein n=1 Tax=Oopsacas minuta TaxID=111878 RepID=A0AAV7JC91_9METZ|nr:hypothetical protein LOD99_9239 [Oopsacas minuta]